MSIRKQNLLLGRLPSAERATLSSVLTPVSLRRNRLLFESRQQNKFVYFPVDAVISFSGDTGQGGTMEVWAVGYEGVAGISSIFGSTNPFRGAVIVPGTALKAGVAVFRRYFDES